MKHPNKGRTTKAKKPLADDPKEAEKRLEELLEKEGENLRLKRTLTGS